MTLHNLISNKFNKPLNAIIFLCESLFSTLSHLEASKLQYNGNLSHKTTIRLTYFHKKKIDGKNMAKFNFGRFSFWTQV